MIDLLPDIKVLPHSEESERAVLGGVLLDPSSLPSISGRLRTQDFYVERHRILYDAFLELQESQVVIDPLTVQTTLEQRGDFERFGGLGYLTALDLDLPDLSRLETYVEIIKERSVRRALIVMSGQIIQKSLDGGLEAHQALGWAEQSIRSVGSSLNRARGLRAIREDIDRFSDRIENPALARAALQGVPSGFKDWDRLGPGLAPGKVVVLAGRPGMGKTSFALNVARHVAVAERRPVGIFSLEMSREELTVCLVCAHAEVNALSLRRGWFTRQELERLSHAARVLYDAPLFIDDSPANMRDIEARSRSFKAENGEAALLVVDYLQMVTGDSRRDSKRNLEVADVSRRTKRLARELEIAALLLSQLSREVTRRQDPRPTLADLAESSGIESDADQVAFVHRPHYYRPDDSSLQGLAELIVAKHRGGETGSVPLSWQGAIQTFKPVDPAAGRPDPF